MLEQFLNHIDQNKLFTTNDKILLAISGGIDSSVMLHLFNQAGFTVGVAHCNFQLRGKESDGDEAFVKKICLGQNIMFHSKRFETEKFATETGQSIQMAARELRYLYFKEVIEQSQYTLVATAHHLSDSLETVLLNFTRGTGLDGLTGISVKQHHLIRPLLFATRAMVEAYAASNHLQWREDASNASDKYNRNLLRNQVIPILKKMNPSLENGFRETVERIEGAFSLAAEGIERFRITAVLKKNDQLYINKQKLMEMKWPAVLLWEIIKDKGFNYDQCKSITSTSHSSGKLYYSQTHQLVVDRNDHIVSKRKGSDHPEIKIDLTDKHASNGKFTLTFETIDRKDLILNKSSRIAQLDPDTVRFPLIWRPWQAGDHFVPFGMSQSKKLSDFLIDAKVSRPDKENVTVLESAGSIVWVVGFRISDQFKISTSTTHVLIVRFTE